METKKQINEFRYGTPTPKKFDILREAWIIGIIDNNGVAHSRQFYYEEAPTHEEIFPLTRDKRWRWDFDKCISTSVYGDTFEKGDGDIIRNHLRREYGIRFWENGYHDIDYFISRMSEAHL